MGFMLIIWYDKGTSISMIEVNGVGVKSGIAYYVIGNGIGNVSDAYYNV